MDWEKLYKMQKELDSYIEENNDVHKSEILNKKVLAMLVEIGELANETRCFKFWSKKAPSDREVILEEYVDGIHFLLSIGLDLDFRFTGFLSPEETADLTEQFNKVFSGVIAFKQAKNSQMYNNMFSQYMVLGGMLNFTEEDIHSAYMAKNELNHERQNSNY